MGAWGTSSHGRQRNRYSPALSPSPQPLSHPGRGASRHPFPPCGGRGRGKGGRRGEKETSLCLNTSYVDAYGLRPPENPFVVVFFRLRRKNTTTNRSGALHQRKLLSAMIFAREFCPYGNKKVLRHHPQNKTWWANRAIPPLNLSGILFWTPENVEPVRSASPHSLEQDLP